MSKIIELLGMLAPFIGLVLLWRHRRRAPLPAALGMVGAALAGIGSVAAFLGEKTIWFDLSDADRTIESLEGWALVRFALVGSGLVLLLLAALLGRGRPVPRYPLAAGGLVATGLGTAMRFVHLDLEGVHGFLRVAVVMALDTVQFGLLGLGVLLLAVAAVSGRDEDPEPLHHTLRIAGSVLRGIQTLRSAGRAPADPGAAARGEQRSGWESWLIRHAEDADRGDARTPGRGGGAPHREGERR